nr:HRAS-like suppressor 3 [Pogona vitticeps]
MRWVFAIAGSTQLTECWSPTRWMVAVLDQRFMKVMNYITKLRQSQDPGDTVEFLRPCFIHYAIAIDKEHVVHLTSAAPEGSPHNCSSDTDPTAEVKIERLSVVAGKCKYRINNKYDKRYEPRPPKDIVRIAKAKAGQKGRHSLFRNDCEEFATRMRYGVPITGQVCRGGLGKPGAQKRQGRKQANLRSVF